MKLPKTYAEYDWWGLEPSRSREPLPVGKDTAVQGETRTFMTGATRDSENGKLDYEAFLSPLVLQRYAEYMHKHRKQRDGTLRSGDNWQRGIPQEQYLKSLVRHVIDFWRLARTIHKYQIGLDLEDLLCAIMFNSMGYLFELLQGREVK